jgi:uncharacterized protein YwqG
MASDDPALNSGRIKEFAPTALSKPGFSPVCTASDSQSPRVSKIGGSIPHLPSEALVKCDCGLQQDLLLQLYVPSLPPKVQELFPSFNGLIVFTYCTECMDSDVVCSTRVYPEDRLSELVFSPPREGSQIEPRTVTNWKEFTSHDFTSDRAYEANRQSGKDEIEFEEVGRIARSAVPSKSYLLGNPWFEQGEYSPGDDYVMLANFSQDNVCTLAWGDAGSGQLWIKKGAAFAEANLTWMCG